VHAGNFFEIVAAFSYVDQKQQRVEYSERCLKLFKQNKENFLYHYVIMYETRNHISGSKKSSTG